MASVEFRGIRKVYGKDVVGVDDMNLTIADKEFLVLVGPSGCGKSTTLRMVAGLETISAGELYIDGRLVNEVPPKDRDIAMVFQNYALYPHMTVFENMSFGLRLRKLPKPEIRTRVEEAAAILDIATLLERKPKELSGGQRQRVALGRAIVRKPKVFLFDEPLSNLDAKLRVQMRTEISKLHKRLGTTVIYVTHDQVEAMTMGERIVVMKGGSVMQTDTPLNLYQRPANRFVAGFVGSPAMNFIEGEVSNLGFRAGDLAFRFPEAVPDGLFTFGIRPEDIRINNLDGTATVPAVVELVEPMGNETFVHVSLGGHPMVIRAGGMPEIARGETITVGLALANAHLFDTENGGRVSS